MTSKKTVDLNDIAEKYQKTEVALFKSEDRNVRLRKELKRGEDEWDRLSDLYDEARKNLRDALSAFVVDLDNLL